jgi:hypothetical protein
MATILFEHACKLGCEGIVSKSLASPYRSGRSPHWIKVKNPKAPAVKREAEEDWAANEAARRATESLSRGYPNGCGYAVNNFASVTQYTDNRSKI